MTFEEWKWCGLHFDCGEGYDIIVDFRKKGDTAQGAIVRDIGKHIAGT